MQVDIYTDGACRGNPGPGGWGALLLWREQERSIKGYEADTTNNRMELTAVIEALRAMKRECEIDLYTDSKYVIDGVNSWMPNWKKNGWKTAAKKAVKNVDLWQLLDNELDRYKISWHWVKGHSGNPGNETADQLANQAIDESFTT
jgi:ribonuclease HI